MQELNIIDTYADFKNALDAELKNQAEGFVRTGYLLKKARDTDILKESGYKNVAEFAQAEYGLSKDIVSRYIAINDRYSVNGYSEQLQEKYKGYGVAKLQEMLTLSDEVVDMLSPDMSKRKIQDIKKEIADENKISDIEVMIEKSSQPATDENKTLLQRFMYQYFHDYRENFLKLGAVLEGKTTGDAAVEKILDVIAPSGVETIFVRIRGLGKIMMSIKGSQNDIELINIRNNEKMIVTWQQMIKTILHPFDTNKSTWEALYNEPFEEKKEEKTETTQKKEIEQERKKEIAPVQQKKESQSEQIKEKKEKPKIEKVEPATFIEKKEPEVIDAEFTEIVEEKKEINAADEKEKIRNAAKNILNIIDAADEKLNSGDLIKIYNNAKDILDIEKSLLED